MNPLIIGGLLLTGFGLLINYKKQANNKNVPDKPEDLKQENPNEPSSENSID